MHLIRKDGAVAGGVSFIDVSCARSCIGRAFAVSVGLAPMVLPRSSGATKALVPEGYANIDRAKACVLGVLDANNVVQIRPPVKQLERLDEESEGVGEVKAAEAALTAARTPPCPSCLRRPAPPDGQAAQEGLWAWHSGK